MCSCTLPVQYYPSNHKKIFYTCLLQCPPPTALLEGRFCNIPKELLLSLLPLSPQQRGNWKHGSCVTAVFLIEIYKTCIMYISPFIIWYPGRLESDYLILLLIDQKAEILYSVAQFCIRTMIKHKYLLRVKRCWTLPRLPWFNIFYNPVYLIHIPFHVLSCYFFAVLGWIITVIIPIKS